MVYTAQSTFNLTILIFAILIGLVAQTSAHGIMISPPTRLQHGDSDYKIKMASDPTLKKPCGASGYGPVTTYKPGEMMLFAFNVSIPHPGGCFVQLNKHGEKEEDFYTVMELGECGKTTGLRTAFVELPHEPCDKCVMRFTWDDDLGNSYLNCADIQIAEDHMMRKRRKARRSLKF